MRLINSMKDQITNHRMENCPTFRARFDREGGGAFLRPSLLSPVSSDAASSWKRASFGLPNNKRRQKSTVIAMKFLLCVVSGSGGGEECVHSCHDSPLSGQITSCCGVHLGKPRDQKKLAGKQTCRYMPAQNGFVKGCLGNAFSYCFAAYTTPICKPRKMSFRNVVCYSKLF